LLEHEIYTGAAGDPAPAPELNHRWSNYLQFGLGLAENLTFHNATFIQPRFDALADYRLLSESALVARVNPLLKIKVAFNLAYDAEPPAAGVEKLDTALATSFLMEL
jgi:hypothetical protein